MASYDGDCGMFAPEGNVYQLDYAQKSTEQYPPALALLQANGAVFLVTQHKAALEIPCASHFFKLGPKIHAIVTGNLPDGRAALSDLAENMENYIAINGQAPTIEVYADVLGAIFERFTHYSQARPYGCHIYITDGRQIYQINPQGEPLNVYAAASGAKWQNARVELEKLMGEMSSQMDRYGHLKRSKNVGGDLLKMDKQNGLAKGVEILKFVAEEVTDLFCEVLVVDEQGEIVTKAWQALQ